MKKIIIILLVLLTVFMLFRYALIDLFPSWFSDYIEYNDIKYYPANDHSIVEEFDIPQGHVYSSLDESDFTVKVKLYKNNGLRVGIFKSFYAENFYGFESDEIPLLIFDSSLYVNDYDLANREPVPEWME